MKFPARLVKYFFDVFARKITGINQEGYDRSHYLFDPRDHLK
jgi:hypothetical protein